MGLKYIRCKIFIGIEIPKLSNDCVDVLHADVMMILHRDDHRDTSLVLEKVPSEGS